MQADGAPGLTRQLEAVPPALQQVMADMQLLACAGAGQHGMLACGASSAEHKFSPDALVAAGLLVLEVMQRFGWGKGPPPPPPAMAAAPGNPPPTGRA